MGSSQRKKNEKAKVFQKPKLKVGKAKAKAANFTDTSFKSKAIVIGNQFHLSDTPEGVAQGFKHQLALASTAKSEKQRRDSLASLTDQLTVSGPSSINPVGTHSILVKLLPLITDISTPVRAQLLRLLRHLPPDDVKINAERVVIFVRAGLTHLSADIGSDALAVLEWILDVAPLEAVSCPGGWVKTLSSLCAVMGWSITSNKGWSSAPTMPTLKARDPTSRSRQLAIFSKFVEAGLRPDPAAASGDSTQNSYFEALSRLPLGSQPFDHLDIFTGHRDEDGGAYAQRDARQQVFQKRFLDVVERGVGAEKKDGGLTGRAAAVFDQVLRKGMMGCEPLGTVDASILLDPW